MVASVLLRLVVGTSGWVGAVGGESWSTQIVVAGIGSFTGPHRLVSRVRRETSATRLERCAAHVAHGGCTIVRNEDIAVCLELGYKRLDLRVQCWGSSKNDNTPKISHTSH